MPKRFWRIRGHKGFDVFFDATIPVGLLTEDQLKHLLRCLAAKAGLDYDEVIGGYVKRRTRRAHGLLDVHKHGPYPEYCCGNDPSFTAIVVDATGNRITYPALPG
jgi:hypothetical protein